MRSSFVSIVLVAASCATPFGHTSESKPPPPREDCTEPPRETVLPVRSPDELAKLQTELAARVDAAMDAWMKESHIHLKKVGGVASGVITSDEKSSAIHIDVPRITDTCVLAVLAVDTGQPIKVWSGGTSVVREFDNDTDPDPAIRRSAPACGTLNGETDPLMVDYEKPPVRTKCNIDYREALRAFAVAQVYSFPMDKESDKRLREDRARAGEQRGNERTREHCTECAGNASCLERYAIRPEACH